jgi:copper chaperone
MHVFKVEGISCQHCVAAITRAIQAQDNAALVQVDVSAGLVRISSSLLPGELQRLLVDQGYPARAMQD